MSRVLFAKPVCGHPDRKHLAKGMCNLCYLAEYRGTPPEKRRYYSRRVPKIIEWGGLPQRAPVNVKQNATTSFPIPNCPKCLRTNTITYNGREARCTGAMGGCGATVFLVMESRAAALPALPSAAAFQDDETAQEEF